MHWIFESKIEWHNLTEFWTFLGSLALVILQSFYSNQSIWITHLYENWCYWVEGACVSSNCLPTFNEVGIRKSIHHVQGSIFGSCVFDLLRICLDCPWRLVRITLDTFIYADCWLWLVRTNSDYFILGFSCKTCEANLKALFEAIQKDNELLKEMDDAIVDKLDCNGEAQNMLCYTDATTDFWNEIGQQVIFNEDEAKHICLKYMKSCR